MKKILQLTTYPIDNPNHGGKIRCFNIKNSLKEHFIVETLSFDIQENESIDAMNVALSYKKFIDYIKSHLFFDWGINSYLTQNKELKQKIFNLVSKYSPHIILLEQPYLYPLVKEMQDLNILNKDIFIIYSSQNIEYPMKREIYSSILSGPQLQKHVDIVKEIEYQAIKGSDLVFAVSSFDLNYIKNIAPQKDIYLFKNGHNGIVKTNLLPKWQDIFTNSKRNWVFIGSWHGPNIKGLHKLLENGLLQQSQKEISLWVFGSVCDGLLDEYNIEIAKNSSLKLMGSASEEDIDSAIKASDGVVLPIWQGGGSNLKTVQALLSNKKIAATEFAFRGFEEFKDDKEIYINSDAQQLVNFISTSTSSDEEIQRDTAINQLKWDNILSSLPQTINKHYRSKK